MSLLSVKSGRSFWLLLVVGILIRCIALTSPLVDSHLLRQCQTAAATRDLMREEGFSVSTPMPWSSDSSARYVLELPLFNYLVVGVHSLIGDLDVSGKLTSIFLWALSFFVLQSLWRRMLDAEQAIWANLLFVLAPLEIFYGQAFMPEMLVQLLAFTFLVLVLRYDEKPSLAAWIAASATGLVALLIKLPVAAHLYLIPAVLIFRREGWRALVRPRYLAAALITIVALKWWGAFRDSVDPRGSVFGSSQEMLRGFIGPVGARLQPKEWAMIFFYVAALVVPGPAFLFAAYGLRFVSKARSEFFDLKLWLLSIIVFYLLWFGNGANKQSYYNLAAVAPFAALGGIGTVAFSRWHRAARWRRTVGVTFALLLVGSVIPVCAYLFRPDRQILSASIWARNHTLRDDVFVFRAQHRWEMVDYRDNAVPAYYSDRECIVWVRWTPDSEKAADLEKAKRVIITLPPRPPTGLVAWLQRLRSLQNPVAENWDWLRAKGFHETTRTEEFVVYTKS